MLNNVHIHVSCPVKAQNAGLFVSRGNAMHPTRILDSHELIFVIQGNLELWEEDKVFNLGVGDVLHLFPHRQHGGVDVNATGPQVLLDSLHYREHAIPSHG